MNGKVMYDFGFINKEEILKSQLDNVELILELSKRLNLPKENFYVNSMNHEIIYYKEGQFICNSLMIDMDTLVTILGEAIKQCSKLWGNKEYRSLYMGAMNIRYTFFMMPDILENPNLSDEDKYEIWKDTYRRLEYNHKEMIEMVSTDFLEKYGKKVKTPNKLTIYRGYTDKSTPLNQAVSWTTSEDTARFFATRYDSHLHGIAKAVIPKEAVLVDMESSEKEVLVKPSYIANTETLETTGVLSILPNMQEHVNGLSLTYLDLYGYFINRINPAYFENPFGVHGVLHTKRVLLHCINLSKEYKLQPDLLFVLCYMAVIHDIGRKHDDACHMHGVWSLSKVKEIDLRVDLIEHIISEYKQLIDFVVTYHCRDDKTAKKALQNSNIQDKKTVWDMYQVFCDADGLDRVRLGDLDVKYLRTPKAKLLTNVAHSFYKNVK